MDINIYGVAPSQLDEAWHDISPFIQMGLDYSKGEMELSDVYERIKENTVVPIVISRKGEILGVLTMEVSQKPQKKIMCLMTAGGTEMDSYIDDLMDVAYKLSVEQGCDAIYINGRPGWVRKLKEYGYEHAYTVLMRDIQ